MTARLRFAVFGHPAAHSVPLAMHTAALSALGLPHTVEAISLLETSKLPSLVDAVRQGTFAGASLTTPVRRAALPLVDRTDSSASMVGAINTLVRGRPGVTGYSTDPAGLLDDLRGLSAVGRTAAVIGSGPGAAAAVVACLNLGASLVVVTARCWPNSELLVGSPLAERFRSIGALPCVWPTGDPLVRSSSRMSEVLRLHWADAAATASVIIQATSAGMRGADPGDAIAKLVPWERVSTEAVAYDLVYHPKETPFLQAARARGLRAANGLGMLARQAGHALSLWLRVSADVDVMRAAAEKVLQGRSS